MKARRGGDLLSVDLRIVGSPEQIVDGHVEVVRDQDQRFVVRLALAVFVAADAILIHVQIHCELQLGNVFLLPQFLQTQSKRHLRFSTIKLFSKSS